MEKITNKIPKMMTFAELYNGLGYRNAEKLSPYLYSGTNLETSGIYRHDGKFDAKKKSENPGIAAVLVFARKEKLL